MDQPASMRETGRIFCRRFCRHLEPFGNQCRTVRQPIFAGLAKVLNMKIAECNQARLVPRVIEPNRFVSATNQDPHETRRLAFGLSAGFFSVPAPPAQVRYPTMQATKNAHPRVCVVSHGCADAIRARRARPRRDHARCGPSCRGPDLSSAQSFPRSRSQS